VVGASSDSAVSRLRGFCRTVRALFGAAVLFFCVVLFFGVVLVGSSVLFGCAVVLVGSVVRSIAGTSSASGEISSGQIRVSRTVSM
jgi:hypothetical protein